MLAAVFTVYAHGGEEGGPRGGAGRVWKMKQQQQTRWRGITSNKCLDPGHGEVWRRDLISISPFQTYDV